MDYSVTVMRTKQSDSLMSCGHPESAVITDRDGTSYCGECEREAKRRVEPEYLSVSNSALPATRRRIKPEPTDPDIEGMRIGQKSLAPFLAVCLACGNEREISLDSVPQCKCRSRRWGVAGCAHCRALVEAS